MASAWTGLWVACETAGRAASWTSESICCVSGVRTKGVLAIARSPRDIERIYSTQEVVAKLRRLVPSIAKDEPFRIQIAGFTDPSPERAHFSIEHEFGDDEE
jgi:hypothetical protein